MNGSFRTLLKKFCLEGSVLGLKYFYIHPDKISRCYWTAVVISAFSLACYIAWALYERFQEMPTRITIQNQYETLESLPYPSVVICTPNQITEKSMAHLKKTLINGRLSKPLEEIMIGMLNLYDDDNTEISVTDQDLRELQTVLELNRYNILDVVTSLPQKCDEFLKYCYLENKEYPCSELFHPLYTSAGLCCAFNSIYRFTTRNVKDNNFKPRMATPVGIKNSLDVVTDYDHEGALKGSLLNAGANKILLSDWTEFPTEEESLVVATHMEFFTFIHATYTYCSEGVHELAVSSRQCYFTNEKNLPFFGQYRNIDCETLCLSRMIQTHCYCLLLSLPYVNVNHMCNVTSLSCIMKFKRQMNKLSNRPCECLRDCDARKYKIESDRGNLNSLPYLIRNPLNNSSVNQSTTILHFAFASMVYTTQREQPVISLVFLQSNLGGIFGLCLGCSCMSLLEIFLYIYVGVKNVIQRLLKKLMKFYNITRIHKTV